MENQNPRDIVVGGGDQQGGTMVPSLRAPKEIEILVPIQHNEKTPNKKEVGGFKRSHVFERSDSNKDTLMKQKKIN